jgi:hypothetical protein
MQRRSLCFFPLAVGALVAVTLIEWSILAPAGAAVASPRFHLIVCTGMQQPTTSPVLLTGCKPRGITGGSGQWDGSGPYTLTWKTGKVLTFSRGSVTVVPSSPCPSGTAEVDFTGTVLSGSGRGTGKYLGRTVAYKACVSEQITVVVVELVPGTNFTVS